MRFAKKGEIQNYCLPNALLTLQEYLEVASPPATDTGGTQAAATLGIYLAAWVSFCHGGTG